jgi:hypothetical protein
MKLHTRRYVLQIDGWPVCWRPRYDMKWNITRHLLRIWWLRWLGLSIILGKYRGS